MGLDDRIPAMLYPGNAVLKSNRMIVRPTRLLVPLTLLLLHARAHAQDNTSTAVNNAAGGSFKNDVLYVDWSLGELARIDTRVAGSKVFMLTQGLLQPNQDGLLFVSDEPVFSHDEVKILPNPVKTQLQVQISVNQPGNLKCMLFTAKGERLGQRSLAYYGYGLTETFNMSNLAAGNYFLYVELEPLKGGTVRKGGYKIIKTN